MRIRRSQILLVNTKLVKKIKNSVTGKEKPRFQIFPKFNVCKRKAKVA